MDIVWSCLRDPFSHFGTIPACECDEQTDERTHDDNIYRASIASRGKIICSSGDFKMGHVTRTTPILRVI